MTTTTTLIEVELDDYWRNAATENSRLKLPVRSLSNSLCLVKTKSGNSTARKAIIGGMLCTTFKICRSEGEPHRVVRLMNLLCDLHGES